MISLPAAVPTTADLVAQASAAAVQTVQNTMFADTPPPGEAVVATPGSAPKARRSDARDARLTSSTYNMVGANGLTTVVFTRDFAKRPAFSITVVENAVNGPPAFVCKRYLKNTGTDAAPVWTEWTDADAGVAVIKAAELYGYRINPKTPTYTFTPLTLVTFLFGTVNNLFQGIVDSLSNKDTSTAIAAGTKFTCIAVASSEP